MRRDMPKYVRVRDLELGHIYTVLAQEAEVNADLYEVLDEPAVNECGDPLPPGAPEEPTDPPPPSGGPLSSLFHNPEGRPAIDHEGV